MSHSVLLGFAVGVNALSAGVSLWSFWRYYRRTEAIDLDRYWAMMAQENLAPAGIDVRQGTTITLIPGDTLRLAPNGAHQVDIMSNVMTTLQVKGC